MCIAYALRTAVIELCCSAHEGGQVEMWYSAINSTFSSSVDHNFNSDSRPYWMFKHRNTLQQTHLTNEIVST